MQTELQQAELFARHILIPHTAFSEDYKILARVFLSQQARLAEVERARDALEAERDGWRRSTYNLGTSNADLCKRIAAAESRLASARVEGAQLQREAWVAGATAVAEVSGCFVCSPRPKRPTTGEDAKVEYRLAGMTLAEHAARRYPAPAAPAGEQTRPAPTPEPLRIELEYDAHEGVTRVALTHEDCRRIVALGSRPTQTAEG